MLADAGLTFVVAPKRTRDRQSKYLEKGVGIERYGAANSRFPVDQGKRHQNANKMFTAISTRVKLRF